MHTDDLILNLADVSMEHIPQVGGKNASLGQMIHHLSPLGVRVPLGFCTTAHAFRRFLTLNNLVEPIGALLEALNATTLSNLGEVGSRIRSLVLAAPLPDELVQACTQAMREASMENVSLAVRSSATAEDLPDASFAGQHDSFLNIRSTQEVLKAIHRCYASLYNDRAIKYRIDHGFDHASVALSVGVQYLVRADVGSSGVAFSVDPDTGCDQFLYVTGTWGLCETIVQGAVNPDEYYCYKPNIGSAKRSLVYRRCGDKAEMMILQNTVGESKPVVTVATPHEKTRAWTLTQQQAEQLAQWCMLIEKHYGRRMDIEWACDGITRQMFIIQARPMTSHTGENISAAGKTYTLQERSKLLCSGSAVGRQIVSGPARIITSLADAPRVQAGDIIVAHITNPDWNALLKKAVGIVTDLGGRTSHASIIARELGIPAVVGTLNATEVLKDGQIITLSCMQGQDGCVFEGALRWQVTTESAPHTPITQTAAMLILADPDKAPELSRLPNGGVGLMRMEFVIANTIRVHPMALIHFDQLPEGPEKELIADRTLGYENKQEFFVEKLSEAIAMVAASFYPKDVIVRMSDFKTNEYAQLIAGSAFEPTEENPMLGFRGASRYYHPIYREAFALECAAVRRVREDMGLVNVKVMIPFCRTVQEGRRVLEVMKEQGLERGVNGLEVYVMAEIPANVLLAAEFAEIFDGFSIGSNDLTQLTLGVDRDSSLVQELFDERNPAVTIMLQRMISEARKANRKIGLCGQAPSDFPEVTLFLVRQGLDSISFTPDALLTGIKNIVLAEKELDDPDS
ncbi:MAG: phosphoenolpyruvate synthase [Candidatus Kapaibacterium sp.]